MEFASNPIMLVEGKHEDQQLFEPLRACRRQIAKLSPWAKSQSQFNSYTSIRRPLSVFYTANSVQFYLSGGRNWVFSLLTKDEGNQVCCEGETFTIIEPRQDIREIFQGDIQSCGVVVSLGECNCNLLTIVSCLAGCKRQSNVRSALYFVGYDK